MVTSPQPPPSEGVHMIRPTPPLTFTATRLEAGCVAYTVDKVGTFTLGWDPDSYPHRPDTDRILLRYGLGTARFWPASYDLPDKPTINRVTLAGYEYVPVDKALAYLDDPDHWPYWLHPQRVPAASTGTSRQSPPDATRARAAHIVAHLVDDFLHRLDLDDITIDHLQALAPDRIDTHQINLLRAETELAEWTTRRDHEHAMIAAQQALLGNPTSDLVDPWRSRPAWRDYSAAATPDGQQFLLATQGVTRR